MIGNKTYTVNRDVGRAGLTLADGQTAAGPSELFQSDAGSSTMLRSVTFFNTNATTQTLKIYMTRSGGTRRQLYQVTLLQNESFDMLADGEVMCLGPGDALEAETTTLSACNYLVTGQVEERNA